MNTTINISLPKQLLEDAKKIAEKRRFGSFSELIRHALRKEIYDNQLTINGFTKKFEDQVLAAAAEPEENDIELKTEKEIKDYFRARKIPDRYKAAS